MNSLDQLIRQSNILVEIIDDLIKSINKTKDKKYLLKSELDFLKDNINRTLGLVKSFMENYNEFLTNQIVKEFDIEIHE